MHKHPLVLFISSEHAGNRIPKPYRPLFSRSTHILKSHRGYDIGAKEMAAYFSKQVSCPLLLQEQSRLLIDVNRSMNNPALFSMVTRPLPKDEKKRIIKQYYHPYRDAFQKRILQNIKNNRTVLHLSVHTFTPKMDDVLRNADIGFLFDPSRKIEKAFCLQWKQNLIQKQSYWIIRQNYPYRGISDGLASWLRLQFTEEYYIGVELEVNQRFLFPKGAAWRILKKDLVDTFCLTFETMQFVQNNLHISR